MNVEYFPLIFGYAEIHFRFFRFQPSLLFNKQPEVYFDVPGRLEPGRDLPVFLIVNDLKRYPSEISDCSIAVTVKNQPILFEYKDLKKFEVNHPQSSNQRAFIFKLAVKDIPENSDVFINAKVTLNRKKKKRIVLNDNLQTSSKLPFKCKTSNKTLPGHEFCTYGDLHVHSIYSQSHVEFGPPLQLIDSAAKASGLDFVAITDHSYDLACRIDNYLVQDQSLERWKAQKSELEDPSVFETILIAGEEISCLNSSGKVVHLIGLGVKDCITGTLDGARQNTVFKSQLTIKQAVKEIHDQGGIAFSAHPGSQTGFFQELLLSRGMWTPQDLDSQIDGIQALNSGFEGAWERGKQLWINMLRKGYRIPILGGNDAHGDFNRYRAISKPFWSIYEGFQRFMGAGKTGIYGKCRNEQEILDKIRSGATFVTTGPFVSISYSDDPNDNAISVQDIRSDTKTLYVTAISTSEFGSLRKITVICGSQSEVSERAIYVRSFNESIYDISVPVSLSDLPRPSYIRVEVISATEDTTYRAFSSACFLGKS
jgi:hypothetical protein